MPAPAEGTVRVFARVNADKLRAGQWSDVPEALLDDYRSLAFISPVDEHGNPAPDDIPQRCCSG